MARTSKDAVKAYSRSLLDIARSLLKEPYNDQLKDPLHDPDKAFGQLDEGKYAAELELVHRYQS